MDTKNLKQKGGILPDTSIYTQNAIKAFCNGILTFCNASEDSDKLKDLDMELSLESEEAFSNNFKKEGRYKISPFGDFPKEGKIQRVDGQAGLDLSQNILSVEEIPIYVGHPDDDFYKNARGHIDTSVFGNVKSIDVSKDGIYANIKWNDSFKKLPKGLRFSARWIASTLDEYIYKPYKLISLGLTYSPNIEGVDFANSSNAAACIEGVSPLEGLAKPITLDPKKDLTIQQKGKIMLKNILKILGYSDEDAQKIIESEADEATQNEVAAKLKEFCKPKETPPAPKEGDLEAKALANENAFKAERLARASDFVGYLVEAGKVSDAQKQEKIAFLANSNDFDGTKKLLSELPSKLKTEKVAYVNLANSANPKAEFTKIRMEKEAAGMDYTQAWTSAKKENEELYNRAYNKGE